MIKQISLIAIVAIGIGALFLGRNLAPAFAQNVPPSQISGCTKNPHVPGTTGDPHQAGDTGNPHVPTHPIPPNPTAC
jgi:hypothetical protein